MWERSTAPPHCCVETSPAALWLVPLSRQLWLIFGGKCSQLAWLVEKERSTVTPTDCPPRLCDYGNVSRRRPYRLGGAPAGRRGGKWTVTANSAGETVDVQTACDPAESTQTQSRYHFKNIKPIMIKGYSIIFLTLFTSIITCGQCSLGYMALSYLLILWVLSHMTKRYCSGITSS